MLSGSIPTSLLVTPWRTHPPFKGPNSKIAKATQLFQYSIWYPVSLKIAALPLQGICVHFVGPFVYVYTAGTSPEGPFTGTFTGPQSLEQGRNLDPPKEYKHHNTTCIVFLFTTTLIQLSAMDQN